mgnify:CR=1 FL=1
MNKIQIKEFLDEKVSLYNRPEFIVNDPISIPHKFSRKEDIEISAFLCATIAWGRREMIIKNATKIMDILDNSPYDFVLYASESEINKISDFCHRTFNRLDLQTFIYCLRNIYENHHGLEACFFTKENDMKKSISNFKKIFFSIDHPKRTEKHISDPMKGSASKRIMMFLRWMIRNNNQNIDFGIWKTLEPKQLSCPLDIHTANVSRKLGLITRKVNDWKAVKQLDNYLRLFCPYDPAKYDFALFGIGMYENF